MQYFLRFDYYIPSGQVNWPTEQHLGDAAATIEGYEQLLQLAPIEDSQRQAIRDKGHYTIEHPDHAYILCLWSHNPSTGEEDLIYPACPIQEFPKHLNP